MSATRATIRAVLAVVAAAAVLSGCAGGQDQASCSHTHNGFPVLEAQAVPSATLIPCVLPLPGGWRYGGARVRSGLARFWLDSDRAGGRAAEVSLMPGCDVAGATELPPGTGGAPVRRFEAPAPGRPQGTLRSYLFTGGCVRYRLAFTRRSAPALYDQADQFLGFTPRRVYVDGIGGMEGLTLCGAEAPPCPG